MSYSFNIIHNETTYDVSNYITEISEFPYYARNYDYSLVIDDMDFKLSSNYLDIYPSVFFDNGDNILIYSASVLLFNGLISKTEYMIDSREYSFNADHRLVKFKEYLMSSADMSGSLIPFRTSKEIYFGLGPPNFIKFDNLYSASFSRLGLNLDWTYRGANEIFTNVPYLSSSYSASNYPLYFEESTKNMILGDLYAFIPQLYCLNQDYVLTDFEIYKNRNYTSKRITLYDFISRLNKISGYIFIPKDSSSYYVVNSRYKPTRNVNTETDYSEWFETKFKWGISSKYIIPYRVTKPEVEAFSGFPFMPNRPGETGKWYYWDGSGNDDNKLEYVTSYYNLIDENDPDVDWLNHLMFFNFTETGSTNAVNLVLPGFQHSTDGLLTRPLFATMGNGYYQEWENIINTEKVASVENYIEINRIGGGKIVSKIKTAEYTITPQDFDGAG